MVDKYSIEKTVDELQEIEDGLVKLMAYRVYGSCVKCVPVVVYLLFQGGGGRISV